MGDMTTVLREMGSRSLKEELEDRYPVHYARDCDILSPGREGFAEAVQAAEDSDLVIMALGGNCGWVHVTGGEGKDRCHLDLPGEQQALLEAVAAVGKPVVLGFCMAQAVSPSPGRRNTARRWWKRGCPDPMQERRWPTCWTGP